METLSGLFIIYAWVHAIFIGCKGKKFELLTVYEKFIAIFAIVAVILEIIGLTS